MKYGGGGAPENKLLSGKKINRLHADYKNDKMNIILGNKEVSMKKAFTMAEVLITIGIIGLIAGLVIPGVMSKYKQKALETGLARFYSVMNQAFYLSTLENGEEKYWDDYGDNSCEFFKKYLANYLKTTEYECGYYNHIDGNRYSKMNDDRFMAIYFPSGDMAVFSYCHHFVYTLNTKKYYKKYTALMSGGPSDQTAAYGSELFVFELAKNRATAANIKNIRGIIPFDNLPIYSDEKILERCKSNPIRCSALIARYGWKIHKNYPYKIR